MYKVIVGFNFSSFTKAVELTIKAMGCNYEALGVWEALHYSNEHTYQPYMDCQ